MEISNNGQGFLRNNLSGKLAYKSFVPTPLNQITPLRLSPGTSAALVNCAMKIGQFQGMLKFITNADMYLAMYVRKEALLSAQIEGTQCTFDDILDPSNDDLLKKDISDVIAYVRASEFAVSKMKELPLCGRLLKETHKVLLEGTRGQEKNPGEFRTSQNWIGPTGCTLNQASYIPPNVEDMINALSDLDVFINEDCNQDPIIKAALIHYQFETIHPFLDGNGRIGRMLITLSLLNDGVIDAAAFYPSYQFKLRRSEYYQQLTHVRECGTYENWINFFAECLYASVSDAIESLEALLKLHEHNASFISENLKRSSANGLRLLQLLEKHPFVDINFVSEELDISRTAASALIESFCKHKVLQQVTADKKRYRVFAYEDYLRILRQGSEPL